MFTIPATDFIELYLAYILAGAGTVLGIIWLAVAVWAARDQRARHRSLLRALLVFLLVLLLPVVGLVVYLLMRPRETLLEAYDRTLEQEALLQQIEERPVCPGCSRKTDLRWLACPYCHTRLRRPCPTCATPLDLQWELCPYCANEVERVAVAAAPVISPELSNN